MKVSQLNNTESCTCIITLAVRHLMECIHLACHT